MNSPPIFNLVCLLWTFMSIPSRQVEGANGTWIRTYASPYTNLVPGGQEGTDAFTTFICRARHPTGLIPGKFVADYAKCYGAVDSSEVESTTFTVLEIGGNSNRYKWMKPQGQFGNNAVEGGYTNAGTKLYICRSTPVDVRKWFWTGKAQLVGNIAQGWMGCVAPWWGGAKSYIDFEILIDSTYSEVECTRKTEVIFKRENNRPTEYRWTVGTTSGSSQTEGNSRVKSNSNSNGQRVGVGVMGSYGGIGGNVNYNHENSQMDSSQVSHNLDLNSQMSSTSNMEITIQPWHVYTETQEFEICGPNGVKKPIGSFRISEEPLPGYEEKILAQVEYKKALKRIDMTHRK